ncbi:MAG: scytonemin biosynthesis PEP-CTERM protein ScyF [Spirirestis rafaelensis WJT71-NPBG6]|nr:scytonemin biosynthesis PEP-CTERM protein ScyF [Spirirestis rafaelensis WJT71-NPBG6]
MLTGGGGSDRFTFNSRSEGIDRITDFNVIDDTIVVSAAGFGGGLVANAAILASQFALGTSATTSSQRFLYEQSTGSLFFDQDGTGPGQFDEPVALAFDPYGNLYAGDAFNNRVNVFDNEGKFVRSIANGQFTGLIEGRPFFGPSSIAFDKNGIGYVGDYSGDRILKFDNGGNIVGTIGSSGTAPGQFIGPSGITISQNSGNIYVVDEINNRIQVLDPKGKPILTFGETGTGEGQFLQPIDIEVDKFENIYVTDSINNRVQVFDKDGKFLSAYGEPSGGRLPQPGEPSPYGDPLDLSPGKFNWTAGSYLDEDDNKLYVGDFFQGRVQVLNVNNSKQVPEPTSMLGLAVLGAGAFAGKLKQRRSLAGREKVKG